MLNCRELYALFNQLRNELGFVMDLEQFKALDELLERDLVRTEKDLHELCTMLWFTSAPSQKLAAAEKIIDQFLNAQDNRSEDTSISRNTVPYSVSTERSITAEPDLPPVQTPASTVGPADYFIEINDIGLSLAEGASGSDIPHYDFSEAFQPTSLRSLQRKWRNLLRSRKHYPDERSIDIGASIRELIKNAFLPAPVYHKTRKFRGSIVFLTDHMGSMGVFDQLSEYFYRSFSEAFSQAGLNRLYYHNYLRGPLFEDAAHTLQKKQEELFKKSGEKQDVLVVFSDGGAQHTPVHKERQWDQQKFFNVACNGFQQVIWLNPLPRKEWEQDLERTIPLVSILEAGKQENPSLPYLKKKDAGQRSYSGLFPNELRPFEEAMPDLVWFWEKFAGLDPNYWHFLRCIAFFPAFSADLLYKLRRNFFLNTQLNIPYQAVAHVLNSPLCRCVGMGLYELRPYLTKAMDRYGNDQHEEVKKISDLKLAFFTKAYLKDPGSYLPVPSYRSALDTAANLKIDSGQALSNILNNEDLQEFKQKLDILSTSTAAEVKGVSYELIACFEAVYQGDRKTAAQIWAGLQDKITIREKGRRGGFQVRISSTQLLDFIREEREKAAIPAGEVTNEQRLRYLDEAFADIYEDISRYFGSSEETHVFRDFALMKLGITEEKLPQLQEIVDALKASKSIALDGLPPAILRIKEFLRDEIMNKNFLYGLTVAWLLGKYDLVKLLYRYSFKKTPEPDFSLSLIYCAALLYGSNSKASRMETERLISWILHSDQNDFYALIGVSYLYFQMWNNLTGQEPQIPELDPHAWQARVVQAEYEKYISRGALKYLEAALQLMPLNPGYGRILRSYLYVWNNIIYYVTKCGSQQEYEKLADKVNELIKFESSQEWQKRFYDTLGWYYIRRSLVNKNILDRQTYLEKAKSYLQSAADPNAPPRSKFFHQRLSEVINQVDLR